MKRYEVVVIINDEIDRPVKHNFHLGDRDPKPGETILGLIQAHYKTAKSIYIKKAVQYDIETCPDCKGEGVIPPCCKGDPRKIECYCHGIHQPCHCENGSIRRYHEYWASPYITGSIIPQNSQ